MEQMQPVMEEESSNLTAGIKRQQDLLSSKTEEVEVARRQTDKIRDLLIMAEGGRPEERRRGDQVEAGPVEQAEEGAGAGGR